MMLNWLGKMIYGLCVAGLTVGTADALPKLSRGTRAGGVIAWQDHLDKTQFHYWPASIPLVLNETLNDPTVKYWGIGRKFLEKEPELGLWVWVMGGTISGTATIDITSHQDKLIREAITRDFGESSVKLLPLDSKPVRVAPIFGENSLGIAGTGDAKFGDGQSFKLGGKYPFLVGSDKNHKFAEYIANRSIDSPEVVNDSSFGVYLVGKSQFHGDPWEFDCKADLRQVWSKVRQRYGVGVGYSWISVNLDYASIQQDLYRSKVIDCNFTEGQLDTETYGRQLFELAKTVMLSLNDPENEYFRFAPNPEPEDIAQKEHKASAGWNVSINAAYSSAHATNKIEFKQKVSYTGTLEREIPSTLILAVRCDSRTEQYFSEAGVSERCISTKKARQFDQWAAAEKKCKNARVQDLFRKYAEKPTVYQEGLRLNRLMDCENSFLFVTFDQVADEKPPISPGEPVAISVSEQFIDRVLTSVEGGSKLHDAIFSQPEVAAVQKTR